jgi:UDP-N-acetylglucosamine diphosphorylase / glucose-1-phosphate thymidylyltransferase / UDP-N-acetylgalactosamine diphosphorylase / glucosamine-1-phosphate N-acetyltransferase / galactosamine-1-phosphate N-acetyltransferase
MTAMFAHALRASDYIGTFRQWSFAEPYDEAPWRLTAQAPEIVSALLATLGPDFISDEGVAVHRSATVEEHAIVKGPTIIGPFCFVANSASLRGGVFLGEGCTIGPATEIKASFMFPGSKLAHLNFVGDSILGAGVNCEAGSIIANYRNELADKRIRIMLDGAVIETDVDKFGALVGDGARVGANAVVAPGALIKPGTIIPRLGHVDQRPPPPSG